MTSQDGSESEKLTDLPWSQPPDLGEKPDGAEFGFEEELRKGKGPFVECSFDELREKVVGGDTYTVATPEFERLAPPSIVESL